MVFRSEILAKRFKAKAGRQCKWHLRFMWLPKMITIDDVECFVWLRYVGCKMSIVPDDPLGYYPLIGDPVWCHKDDILFETIKDNSIKNYCWGYHEFPLAEDRSGWHSHAPMPPPPPPPRKIVP